MKWSIDLRGLILLVRLKTFEYLDNEDALMASFEWRNLIEYPVKFIEARSKLNVDIEEIAEIKSNFNQGTLSFSYQCDQGYYILQFI